MFIDKLPSYIQNSVVLSDQDKSKLLMVKFIPTEYEVDAVRHLPEVQELLNAFIGDENTRETHQHLKAREYLQKDDVLMAWKILLL